jgi:hypothetical protein
MAENETSGAPRRVIQMKTIRWVFDQIIAKRNQGISRDNVVKQLVG